MVEFEVGKCKHDAAKLQKVYLCGKFQCHMSDNLFIDNLKQSTGMRVFIFLVILLVSSLVGAAISAAFMFASDLGMKNAQGISSILMFVVPPIVYYFITRKEHAMPALGFRAVNKPWLLYILIGAALMFVSLPVTNQLTAWNEAMNFGSTFERLEEYMKTLEEAAQAATEKMLKADNIGGLLFNLLIIALIPAVGEELTFRGVLQQGLTRRMNPHVAIILSAAIFSFIHFQFYGFLPRMFLGILLGYMFYVSGSLWTSILMHFVNNGTAVVLYYLNDKGIVNVDVDHFGAMSPTMVAISAVVTIALIVVCWRKSKELVQEDERHQ